MASRKGRAVAGTLAVAAMIVVVRAAAPLVSERLALRRLDSDDPATRTAAIRRLGRLGSTRAVPHLVEILRREAPAGEETAFRALRAQKSPPAATCEIVTTWLERENRC